jgi:alkaline phosphatase
MPWRDEEDGVQQGLGGGRMRLRTAVISAGFALTATTAARAQTIYPLDRAEILAGSRFDLKVEFPGGIDEAAAQITINGRPAAAVIGKPATFLIGEEGQSHNALWIKDAELKKPGKYVVEAKAGGKSASVTWEVFGAPAKRRAKNVILFVGDGMSVAHRTAARILSKGIKEGHYGGELAIDDMPHMALISTAGTDTIVTDSANSAAAYTTGHKSCNNALGTYCANNKDNLAHPRVETLTSIAKRRLNLAVGVVTNTEVEDATPASMVANTRRRLDYGHIVRMFSEQQPDIIMGGGTPWFLPKSAEGSRREDEIDYIQKFKDLGYTFVTQNTEMKAAGAKPETRKILGLFNNGHIDGALDRRILKKGTVARYPDQPDLVDMVKVSLDILSKKPEGFVLLVESGRIDKYTHSLDWERAVFDTIMLDNAVKAAKDWAKKRKNDTMIVVVPDHTHPVSIIGTYDDSRPGDRLRDKLGVYTEAGFPNYPAPDADGYPTKVDVSKRIAFSFGAYPDHCATGKPFMDGEHKPTNVSPDGKTAIANEAYCAPGTARTLGNLPAIARSGVHAGDDAILTAMGPGAERFRGHLENTRVFRYITEALGLGR